MNTQKRRKIIYSGLLLALLIFNIVNYSLTIKYVNIFLENRLELAKLDLNNRITFRISSYSDELYSAASLFAVNPNVTPEQWHTFISHTDVFTRHPGIDVIAYAPVIQSSTEEDLQRRATGLGITDYAVKPSRSTNLEAPVLFMEPHVQGYENVLGFNLFSEAERKAALNKAIDSNDIALTNIIRPQADKGQPQKSIGLLMVLPIYKNGADLSTVDQRRASVIGFVTAGIRPEKLMEGIALKVVPGIKFQLFDDSKNGELSEANLLYNSGGNDLIKPEYTARYLNVSSIQLPNTIWHLRVMVVAETTFARLVETSPYLILLLSLVVSIIIFFIALRLIEEYENYKLLASESGKRLIAEDAVVDAYIDGIIATDPHGLITVFNKKAEQVLGYFEPEVIMNKTLVSLISPDSLRKYAKATTQQGNGPISQTFDYLITKSLIDGYDRLDLEFITKSGRTLSITVDVRPLYDQTNFLLGYQFIFR